MSDLRPPVRYGLFGLGGLLEIAMGVVLVVGNPGRPFMWIGIVLAIVGAVILVLRIRGRRSADAPTD
jgi:drug/metabolite transporter (DMT)-like permease